MSNLQPNVLQMLEIGKRCGLTSIEEAYQNYMNHYDCFFLIDKYNEQKAVFDKELIDLMFVELRLAFIDISIDSAISKIKGEMNDGT